MVVLIKRAGLVFFVISFAVSVALSVSQNVVELPNEAVAKKILDNGLTILVKSGAPRNLVVIDVKVRAGLSAEGEFLGSGISHLVEHMLFKGTKSRGAGAIEKEVKSYGGIINGSTSHDMTDFYIILPSKYLPQAIAILKDMLLNAELDQSEIVKEKEVILKEIGMREDDPQSRLMRLLNERAYLEHAYKIPAIGYAENLKALTREDLVKYYNTRYAPNRMIVTVVGGVEINDAISRVEKEFGDFRPANYGVLDATRTEPAQIQPRGADEEMETNLAYCAMGFHSTGILSGDLFAMDVLSMILGRGDNSRLNRKVYKEKGLVHTISSWNYTPKDPGLFVITAVLDKDKLAEAEKAIMQEVERLRTSLVDGKELDAAKRMVVSDFISSLETIDAQANDISSNYALTESPEFSRRYVKGVGMVTREDLKRVADRYLRPDNITVVTISPRSKEKPVVIEAKPFVRDVIKKLELPNGLKAFVRQDNKTPMISITMAVRGGSAAESVDDNGISNITADLMLRSTKTRPDSGLIKGRIQDLGGDISAFSGADTFGITISVLKPDIDIAVEILKDVLVNADFPEGEVENSRSFMVAAIKKEDDDIFETGVNRLRKELFGDSHYGLRAIGEVKSVRSLRRSSIAAFYEKYLAPNNMVIAVSGDVDPATIIGRLKGLFSGLKARTLPAPGDGAIVIDGAKTAFVAMDKEQSLLMLGFKTVPRKDPDRYALEVLSVVLSGSSGRLFDELRNKLSLAYTLGCWQDSWRDEGMFAFYVATTKENLPKAKRALTDEIEKVKASGVTDEEIIQAKRELSSRHQMAMQSNDFFAFNFAVEELRGLGYDNIYRYEAEIDKVTKEAVKAAADKYFVFEKSAEVIVSPK